MGWTLVCSQYVPCVRACADYAALRTAQLFDVDSIENCLIGQTANLHYTFYLSSAVDLLYPLLQESVRQRGTTTSIKSPSIHTTTS